MFLLSSAGHTIFMTARFHFAPAISATRGDSEDRHRHGAYYFEVVDC
jgi:hypothetical protein